MGTIKILGFDEDGNAQRLKIRIARFLDYDPVTASDKSNIRSTLGITSQGGLGDLLAANNLDDVASLDTTKANLEIPDVGTDPSEVPLNQHLGSLAYADADSVSVAELQVESTTGTATTQALTVTDGTDDKFVVQESGKLTATSAVDAQTADFVSSNGRASVVVQSAGASNSSYVSLKSGANEIAFLDGRYDSSFLRVATNKSDAYIAFETGSQNEAVRIDSSQRVGIGTASPDQLIHASSSTGASLRLERDSVTITSGQSYGAIEWEGQDASGGGAASGVRAKIETEATSTSGAVALKFYTAAGNDVATERWSIDSSGNLVANGTAIDFGSGATLDDYEEGVHTTTMTPDTSGSITLSTSYDGLAYTKIGRSIIVTGQLLVSSVSSPVGNAVRITLPTSTLNLGDFSGGIGGGVAYHNGSSWSPISCAAGESSNQLFAHVDASTVAANDQFRFSICYQSA